MKQGNNRSFGTITEMELAFALPGFLVGVAVLSLPHQLASETIGSDGWVAIVIGGMLDTFITLLASKLALTFPGQTFLSYSSSLVTKPVAMILNFSYTLLSILIAAYVIRGVSDIAKHYLFANTPIEVLALSFLLVVVYAVAGSRLGLFWINILFFPIILSVLVLVIALNIRWVELNNFLPVFKSDFGGYLRGLHASIGAYTGFGIVLFYTSLLKKPKNMSGKIILALGIPVLIYLSLFLITIGVFGNAVTSNLIYPVIELAKRVEFPGGFIERIESIFYIVWIMAIFSTAAFSFDIAVFTLQSVWKKISKIKIIIILSPLIFSISMLPESDEHVELFSTIITSVSVPFTTFVTIMLLIVAKMRGVKRNG